MKEYKDFDFSKYWIDVPPSEKDQNGTYEEWKNIAEFGSMGEAIKFAQDNFGADELGRISILTPQPSPEMQVEYAKKVLEQNGYIIDMLFGPNDIIELTEMHGITLTRQEVFQVVEKLHKTANSSVGINWDIIEMAIMDLFGDRVKQDDDDNH